METVITVLVGRPRRRKPVLQVPRVMQCVATTSGERGDVHLGKMVQMMINGITMETSIPCTQTRIYKKIKWHQKTNKIFYLRFLLPFLKIPGSTILITHSLSCDRLMV